MIWILLLGGILASFTYVMVSANNIDFLYRRSYCDSCHYTLKWVELIPLFSFIFLRGKCSQCGASIDRGAFICEVLLIFLYSLPLLYDFSLKDFTLYYLVITLLIPISINDVKTYKIPNHMNLIFLFTGLYLTELLYVDFMKDTIIILILHLFYILLSDYMRPSIIMCKWIKSFLVCNHRAPIL
ncbi:prepilin peptidase [Salinicoccus hispanicus]|uniref:Prepilin peptidase A24 N-terminal domain-containing protein n=1 Tax=Salinicoccus hispanicus TaxID=157225 RepID=A0A6N8U1L7_9STAP|nr:hypothetical protein [Salinicoccus hispanicus]